MSQTLKNLIWQRQFYARCMGLTYTAEQLHGLFGHMGFTLKQIEQGMRND